MAIRFDADADGINRTTAPPDYNATYTCLGWFQLATDRNDTSTFFYLGTATASFFDYLCTGTDGTTLTLYANGTNLAGSALTLNTWYHLALVRESATSLKAYLNGALDITNTTNVGTGRAAAGRLELGTLSSLGNVQAFNGRVAGIKVWDAALTVDEVLQELPTLRPQRYANLHLWSPCWPGSGERTLDYSGNGRNWTENGLLTDEDPPPVSYGAPVLWYPLPLTVQLVFPASDGSVGSWTGEGGETTNLYTHLNENPAVDSTYVQSGLGPANFDTLTGRLAAFTIPTSTTGWALLVRDERAPATAAVTLRVNLYLSNGTTLVHTEDVVLGGTVALTTITLTPTEAALVTQGEATAGLVYKLLPVAG